MGKVTIEDVEVKIEVTEDVLDKSVYLGQTSYTEVSTIKRTYVSEFFNYGDYNVLISKEQVFNEAYVSMTLFNDLLKKAYKFSSLSANLDISLKRVSEQRFIIFGINHDAETLGQVTFATLTDSGKLKEVIVNFDRLIQRFFINKRYLLLNTIETVSVPGSAYTHYITAVTLYKLDGGIEKVLFEEKENKYMELMCFYKNGILSIVDKTNKQLKGFYVVKEEGIKEVKNALKLASKGKTKASDDPKAADTAKKSEKNA